MTEPNSRDDQTTADADDWIRRLRYTYQQLRDRRWQAFLDTIPANDAQAVDYLTDLVMRMDLDMIEDAMAELRADQLEPAPTTAPGPSR